MNITFIIPAHNEEALIGACLNSVVREVRRTNCDAEIIVVDNASNDRTGEIARGFPEVTVIEEPRKGLSFARQAGFEVSKNELLANVDADTKLTPEWIPTVLRTFENEPHIVALSGPFMYYDLSTFQRGLVTLWYGVVLILHAMSQFLGNGAVVQGGNFVLRRKALEQIGGFDTSIDFYGEDTDIAHRIAKVGRVRWTFALPLFASGRRLKEEGIVRTGLRYALNHFSILYFKKPFTREHRDIRSQ